MKSPQPHCRDGRGKSVSETQASALGVAGTHGLNSGRGTLRVNDSQTTVHMKSPSERFKRRSLHCCPRETSAANN